MISTLLTAALTLSTFASASAIRNKRDTSGILRLPVTAKLIDSLASEKRQVVVDLDNVQTGTRYLVDFEIGTPPQAVSVALDTGSSETWVNPDCLTTGNAINNALCASLPKYNPSLSSTANNLLQTNTLFYGKGQASISYYDETFTFGGASITKQIFGVATASSDIPTGLMGVGPGKELTGYPIIIDTLAEQGVTNSRAFSLDLRSVDTPTGAIIFGGIDTKKYKGPLEKCPIIPASEAPDGFDRYWIHMNSVGITKPGEAPKTYTSATADPKGLPVFLDSGGTLSRIPTILFNQIVADFPDATFLAGGYYQVPCTRLSEPGTIDFTFGATTINVPFNEFIWQVQGICVLGIAIDDDAPVLGDSFLRAAFVVYDQDNKNLHVANAVDCGSNLVAIGKGPDAVPSLVGECGASSTSSSSISSSTSSSTSSSSSSTITSDSSTITSSSSSATITSDSSSTSSSETITSDSSSSTSATITSVSSSASVTSTSVPYPLSNSTSYGVTSTSASEYTTSTIYTTSVYTVTSCKPYVTDCPVGHLTTETIALTTTVCPVTPTPTPTAYTTSTVYATSIYTITSCSPTVKDCSSKIGHLTTEIKSLYTTVCPVKPTPTPSYKAEFTTSTAYLTKTYTITKCAPSVKDCPYGSKTTEVETSTAVHMLTYTEYSTETIYATSSYEVAGQVTHTYAPVATSVYTKYEVPATNILANPVPLATPGKGYSTFVPKPSTTAAYVTYSSKPSASVVYTPVATFTGAASSLKVGGMVLVGLVALVLV